MLTRWSVFTPSSFYGDILHPGRGSRPWSASLLREFHAWSVGWTYPVTRHKEEDVAGMWVSGKVCVL